MPHTHRYTHYEYDRHEKYTHTENDMPVFRDSHEYNTLTLNDSHNSNCNDAMVFPASSSSSTTSSSSLSLSWSVDENAQNIFLEVGKEGALNVSRAERDLCLIS